MQFEKDIPLPEHFHEAQWAVVLEGRIDMVIEGEPRTYTKGDRYYIPAGARHSGRIYAGYADITFFNQSDRYKSK
jgi:quercetin dioxygenase-like cupin family protein